jgi:cytochrome P450
MNRAQRYGDTFRVGGKNPLSCTSVTQRRFSKSLLPTQRCLRAGRWEWDFTVFAGRELTNITRRHRHQRQRRLLMPPFHGERMRTYGKLICDITEQVMSQWKIGEPFYVRSSMQEISLRVILQAVFGLHEGQRFDQLRQLLNLHCWM